MVTRKGLTAPCGLDCFNCEIHEDNLTETFASVISEKFGVPLEVIPCKGCRRQDGNHWHLPPEGCATLTCVKERGVELCCDCEEFPCPLLAPIAEGAATYPHNLKIYNLCRIREVGIERWIEEAGEIRTNYFTKKFLVGKGQA